MSANSDMTQSSSKGLSLAEWEKAAGTVCPRCGRETLVLITVGMTGNRRICRGCLESKRRVVESKLRRPS